MMTLDAVQDSVINQLEFFPQEKIHLHTDRTMYISGEKIWFKAYAVDAISHQSPTYSQYAYIELINSADSLVHRVMVTPDENGLFHGYLFLSDLIPEGDYTLRAYTRHMENLGDDYFFKKPVHIDNLKPMPERRTSQPRANYDVFFFPEGGNLVEGTFGRVAFKALNQQGASESVTGEIVDNEGNVIVSDIVTVFAGMGSFPLIPQQGKEYFLVSKNSSGQEKRFKLPPAIKSYALNAVSRNNRHFIFVKKSPDIPERPFYLLVHSKGEVLYFDSWNHNREFITFSNSQLPSGVLQALLFDEFMNPVSERLIFNKTEDQVKLAFSLDKSYYAKREKVSSEIYITDTEGNPLEGHVSIAITDNKDIAIDSLNTITSSLLLSSELRGYIESPGYYLQNHKYAEEALDHLMMTHGWRRYEVSEAIKGNYMLPKTEFEFMKEISGSVKNLFGRPVANGEVIIMSSDGDIGETATDSNGLFSIHAHYPDSIKFFVQTKNQRGKDHVELIINHEKFPKLKYVPVSLLVFPARAEQKSQPINNATDVSFDFLKKAEQRAQYDENIKILYLDEVVVTAKRRVDPRDEVRLDVFLSNRHSNVTIYREDIEKKVPLKVSDLLYNIVGVYVSQNGLISIRGSGRPPLLLLDGMPYDGSLNDLSVQDIESIDVFKGGGIAIFGGRGADGVISVTMKRGLSDNYSSGNSFNNTSYTPIGYQKPVEFYSPKYDTPQSKNLNIPDYRTTIYWKPDLLVPDDGKASFYFYTSDFPTTYSVVIEGISYDGKIIRQVETIIVR